MRRVVVIHYDEIGTKGRNRSFFERALLRSLKEVAHAVGPCAMRRHASRVLAHPGPETDPRALGAALAPLPGVRSVLLGLETEPSEDAIREAVREQLPGSGVASFGVRVRRTDKGLPFTSSELEARLGSFIQERRPWSVDLSAPDLWVRVELAGGRALVCLERIEGGGGLPTGSSGAGVALLSGGIDSPVAAHAMMARGLRLTLVHFHSAPYTSRKSQEKVRHLARILCRTNPVLDLFMIPFADPVQQAIVEHAREPYRVLLYRRFMLRLADQVADEVGASCLVTGEALGQVASQTVENMTSVQAVARRLVLRPLVGMGKAAIIDRARSIGTYDVSIQPHDDCCSFLMPREPATRSTPGELEEAEADLDAEDLVARAFAQHTRERLRLRELMAGQSPAAS